MSGCELCGAKADLKCSRCLTTYYCCRKHQKKDWPRHKTICRPAGVFPSNAVGVEIRPPKDKPCYFRICGEIKDGWGNAVGVDQRFPITAEQLARLADSPSHACTFVDDLTRPETAFMTNLRDQARAQGFKCTRWSEGGCDQPMVGLTLHASCMLMNVPVPPLPSNEFRASIVHNGCFCANKQCFDVVWHNLLALAEALREEFRA